MKIGKARRIPESACTNCNHKMDGATTVGGDAAPEPGDFTVCIRCGHVMTFGDDLRLRNQTDDEMIMVAGDARLIAIQKARKMMKGAK